MQAQATRSFNRNVQKLAGGLLIAAALAAGAVGLTTVGDLELPGTGSHTSSVAAPVYDTHVGPAHGEGLPRSRETHANVVDAVTSASQMRALDAPQGEGYPSSFAQPVIFAVPAGVANQVHVVAAPQGEGFPMNVLAEAGQQESTPLGEGLPIGSGQ